MTAQIIYLNTWLDCPDDQLRFHFRIQNRVNEEKAKFWHGIRDVDRYQQFLCYDRWVNSNRERLKIVSGDSLAENDLNSDLIGS